MRDILAAFTRVRPAGNGFTACCPAHEDARNSLSIGRGDDGRWLLKCHAGCELDVVLAAAHLELADLRPAPTSAEHGAAIDTTFDYPDEHGTLQFQVVRFAPKNFRQRRPDGRGGWIWNLEGVRRVPYRLPELKGRRTVFVAEGEKDVDRLWSLELPSTTNAGGAGKWRPEHTEALKAAGCELVVILPDNDPPGAAHGRDVARSCVDAGLEVKLIALPGLPAKGDASDYLVHHTAAELLALVDAAPFFRADQPVAAATALTSTGTSERDVDAERARKNLLHRAICYRASEAIDLPRAESVVEDVVDAGRVTLLPAESGSGKTFVALSLTAAVDANVPWCGRRVKGGAVIYVSFEGDAFGARLRGLRDVQGYRLDRTWIIQASEPISPRLTSDGEQSSIGEAIIGEHLTTIRERAIAAGFDVAIVVFDTVRQAMSGSEDSSEHTSAFLRAVRRLAAIVPSAGVLLVHHTGWMDGDGPRKRERGSSAWRGNVDTTLYLEAGEYDRDAGETLLTLTTKKSRDGELAAPLHLIRRRVELPGQMTRHGDPVTTCIIEPDRRTHEARTADAERAADAVAGGFDLALLRLMAERPELTSQDALRVALNVRKAVVSAAVARVVRRGWAAPGGRGRGYTVTPAGQAAIGVQASEMNSSQPFPTVPGTVPNVTGTVPPLRGTVPGTVRGNGSTSRTVPGGDQEVEGDGVQRI